MAQIRVTVYGPTAAAQKIIDLLSAHFCVDSGEGEPRPGDYDIHHSLRVEVPVNGDRALLSNGAARLARGGVK